MEEVINKLLKTELLIVKELIELAIKADFKNKQFFIDFLDELNELSTKY